MNDVTIGLEQTEEEMLTYEVSDERWKVRQERATKKRGTTRFISAPL